VGAQDDATKPTLVSAWRSLSKPHRASEGAYRTTFTLDRRQPCSHFVLMAVESLGEALDYGWRVTVRCAWGPRDGMKRIRECVYGGELDLKTLVWTRGRDFPLARLESRLNVRVARRAA